MEEQRALRARTCLGELLGRHDPEGEAGVDELRRQPFGGGDAALEQRTEAQLLGVGNAVVELGERLAVVQIGGVDDVTRCP